jgi:ATP dependent DNA ligase domain
MAKAALPPAAQLGQSGIRAAGLRHCLSAALAVLCLARGLDGELRRRAAAQTAILYAFDLIEHDGEDLYDRPFLDRKAELARLLRDAKAGILFNEHVAEDGPTVFAHACRLSAEGIAAKRVDGTYRSGPCSVWIKVRNPASIAVQRERGEIWHGTRQRVSSQAMTRLCGGSCALSLHLFISLLELLFRLFHWASPLLGGGAGKGDAFTAQNHLGFTVFLVDAPTDFSPYKTA